MKIDSQTRHRSTCDYARENQHVPRRHPPHASTLSCGTPQRGILLPLDLNPLKLHARSTCVPEIVSATLTTLGSGGLRSATILWSKHKLCCTSANSVLRRIPTSLHTLERVFCRPSDAASIDIPWSKDQPYFVDLITSSANKQHFSILLRHHLYTSLGTLGHEQSRLSQEEMTLC